MLFLAGNQAAIPVWEYETESGTFCPVGCPKSD